MARVTLTRHLHEFFPVLRGQELELEAASVAELVAEIEKLAPGFTFYICDERGALRTHVNVFIEDERIVDRVGLSDRLKRDSRVFILQALSGG